MKRTFRALIVALAAGGALSADNGSTTWSFDADTSGAPPAGFRFEQMPDRPQARWVVRKEGDARSGGQALAQTDSETIRDRFAMAVADAPSLTDLRLSVKCKPISGKVDQACGLVFRYRDASNYYVTRSNALEGNVRLYFVKDGRRQQIASWNGKVSSDAWHELGAEARGERFEVSFDGAKVIEATDSTFGTAGRVGVWIKADSVTLFDDLTATSLQGE